MSDRTVLTKRSIVSAARKRIDSPSDRGFESGWHGAGPGANPEGKTRQRGIWERNRVKGRDARAILETIREGKVRHGRQECIRK